ncbi:CoA transferase [Rhodococcus sp. 06-412-2C]|uniref:CaiB/BaiF CoA transferase family protein n=1 Tax=unclassified Rhodococcus (in: high G+C Gram-positive bacteria) TaxID=192944 RepID=UPI000B9BB703|nr:MULTISPECIES: CoA transferase [unclassified Rhodococcus (in: high G+C Gram-positive bacteria)]OZC84931.1 CoA transferase [Rhodococcus sp. 06-412-2C]OZC98672.1 CoA transferase [Rhodococcus sp. 06-412-2B]
MTNTKDNAKTGLLAGIRVIEFASVIMAPYAGQQLGDLGADVIKVEPPGGDMTRSMGSARHTGMAGATLNLNRNKRSVVVDAKAPGGREAMLALVATADVFITNVRPDAIGRLGLTYEDLRAVNPRLIYARGQGFRSDSKYGNHAAYDDIVQAASGLVALNEQVTGEPYFVPTVLVDKICGMQIVSSVLAALVFRDRTGVGQNIEIPMADTMLAFNLVEHLAAATLDPEAPYGYRRALSSSRRAQRTADGSMCILPYSDRNWRDFFTFVDRTDLVDDPRFTSMSRRAENADDLYRLVSELTPSRTSAEWQEFCDRASIPAAPVLDLKSASESNYAVAGGLVVDTEHPTEGTYRQVAVPVRYSAYPRPTIRPCPTIGEHTDEVFAEIGYQAQHFGSTSDLTTSGVTS